MTVICNFFFVFFNLFTVDSTSDEMVVGDGRRRGEGEEEGEEDEEEEDEKEEEGSILLKSFS